MTASFVLLVAAGISLAATMMTADANAAQSPADRPVRIVTNEPGGALDIAARTMAQTLAAEYARSYVIDNRGGGVIGPEIVAKASPDGNTLLFYGNTLWLLPLMRTHMTYNPQRDLLPISLGIVSPTILVVHSSLAVNSAKDLVALARSKPGQLNYASAAAGTGNHLAAELFKYMANIDLVRVAYKGGANALIGIMSGETQVHFAPPARAMQVMKEGKVKALGVTSATPSALAPGLPTVASAAGLPGYESVYRAGFFAPIGTPTTIVNQISREFARVLQRSDIREKLLTQGIETVGSTPQEFAAFINSELSVMGKVIKQAGIRDE